MAGMEMTDPRLIVTDDAPAFAAAAVEHIVTAAADASDARQRFTLVLAGGSTPAMTYELLAQASNRKRIDWPRVFLFLGDERFVPTTDSLSNFRMIRDALLSGIPIPDENVFPIPTDRASPRDSARAYATTLGGFFGEPTNGPPPTFDLVLLGLGDDGHTASLFPGARALTVTDAWVTWSPPGVLPPSVDRITMSYPVLNAAREVLFLVAGENKAEPLRDVLENHAPANQRPASGIQPKNGTLTWLVDRAASSLLREST